MLNMMHHMTICFTNLVFNKILRVSTKVCFKALYRRGSALGYNKPHILQAHQLIRDSKLPSYLHCRIPVQSGLNIRAWRHYLSNYWDQQLCDLLEFGFPLDFDRSCRLHSIEENHTSANENMDQNISKF